MSGKPRGVSCGFEEVATSSLILTLLLYPLSVWHPHSSHPHTQDENILLCGELPLNTAFFSDRITHTWIETLNTSTTGNKKNSTALFWFHAAEPDISCTGVQICAQTKHTETQKQQRCSATVAHIKTSDIMQMLGSAVTFTHNST